MKHLFFTIITSLILFGGNYSSAFGQSINLPYMIDFCFKCEMLGSANYPVVFINAKGTGMWYLCGSSEFPIEGMTAKVKSYNQTNGRVEIVLCGIDDSPTYSIKAKMNYDPKKEKYTFILTDASFSSCYGLGSPERITCQGPYSSLYKSAIEAQRRIEQFY